MKRFVDLGHQLGSDDDWPREFAWYSTVSSQFECHSGGYTWASWDDFEADFEGEDLSRYRSLAPRWVFKAVGWRKEHDDFVKNLTKTGR